MRKPTSLRSSIAPVKRHSERHNHQLFSVCFFANLQNTKPSSKEIGRGSMWQYQTVQWADESRKNPVCWLLWELPIKLFSTSAPPSALLPLLWLKVAQLSPSCFFNTFFHSATPTQLVPPIIPRTITLRSLPPNGLTWYWDRMMVAVVAICTSTLVNICTTQGSSSPTSITLSNYLLRSSGH